MTGTFGGALEVRGISASDGLLCSDSIGELEKEGGVLVIKRIHVNYILRVDINLFTEKESAIQRAFELHPNSCPVYKSIHSSIEITKTLEVIHT